MKNKNFLIKSIQITYKDFANNSSIHGLKYTVRKESSVIERIIWAAIILAGAVGSIFMLRIFWNRFTSNPTRTSVATNYAPTISIPFPVLTICNINPILSVKVNSFLKKLDLLDQDEEYIRNIFPQLLAYSSSNAQYNISDLNNLQKLLNDNEIEKMSSIMNKIGQTCREMLVKCKWEAKIIDCAQYFENVFTKDGNCCTFNLARKKKFHFRMNNKTSTTRFYGFQMGLSVLLNPMLEEVHHSGLYSNGMKVMIHHPGNYIEHGSTQKIIAIGRESLLQLSGTRYICSKDVRYLNSEDRKCVYPDEYRLKYFSKYSESSCMAECNHKRISDICECTPYFYTFSNKPACNMTRIPCIRRINDLKSINCYCPPLCEDVSYTVVSTNTQFLKNEYLTPSFLYGVNTTENTILLHVFFSSRSQTILLRDVLTSTIYLFSSFGGIFSLFLGCSFISGVEIMYYIIIRLWLNYKKLKKIGIKNRNVKFEKSRFGKNNWISDKHQHINIKENVVFKSNRFTVSSQYANAKQSSIFSISDKNVFVN